MNTVETKTVRNFYDLCACFQIREEVFVNEQQVDAEEEWDDFDRTATHLIAFREGAAVGTCRYRSTSNGVKMERFAVLSAARGFGVGAALLKQALEQVLNHPIKGEIYLHSQEHAMNFYGRFGFRAVGERFYEADIPHFKMIYKP